MVLEPFLDAIYVIQTARNSENANFCATPGSNPMPIHHQQIWLSFVLLIQDQTFTNICVVTQRLLILVPAGVIAIHHLTQKQKWLGLLVGQMTILDCTAIGRATFVP